MNFPVVIPMRRCQLLFVESLAAEFSCRSLPNESASFPRICILAEAIDWEGSSLASFDMPNAKDTTRLQSLLIMTETTLG